MVKKSIGDKQIIAFIRHYGDQLKEHGVFDAKIVVFGSFARGTQTQDSDIDMCVLSSTFGKDYHDEAVMLRRILSDSPRPVDVVPYHPDDLKDRYDSLASEITRYGITVV